MDWTPEQLGPEARPFHRSMEDERQRPEDYGDRSIGDPESELHSCLRILAQKMVQVEGKKGESDQKLDNMMRAQERQMQIMKDLAESVMMISENKPEEAANSAAKLPRMDLARQPGYGEAPRLTRDTPAFAPAYQLRGGRDEVRRDVMMRGESPGGYQPRMDRGRSQERNPYYEQRGRSGWTPERPSSNYRNSYSPSYDRGPPRSSRGYDSSQRSDYRSGWDRGERRQSPYRQGGGQDRYSGSRERQNWGQDDRSRRDQPWDRRSREGSLDRRPRSLSGVRADPRRYNINQEDCMKCGMTGHLMADRERCPLGHLPLTDRPCYRCQRGGHREEHCVAKIAKNYRAN